MKLWRFALVLALALGACGDDPESMSDRDGGGPDGSLGDGAVTVDGSLDAALDGGADGGADGGVDASPDAYVDLPPSAIPIRVEGQIGRTETLTLAGSDPEGAALSFEITAGPTNGSVDGPSVDGPSADGTVTYTPDAAFTGEDTLTYVVRAGDLVSDPATVTIVVIFVSDGTLDTTFGEMTSPGIQTAGASSSGSLSAVVELPDGRLRAFGNAGSANLLIVGYEADGSLETDFGTAGSINVDIAGGYDGYTQVGVQSDGSLVAAGQSVGSSRDFLLARYSPEGVLDTTFGTEGYTTTDRAVQNDSASSLIVLDDDRLLVGGYAQDEDDDFAIARYSADGVLDTTFGTDGWALLDIDGRTDRIRGMTLDGEGRIVAVGESATADGLVWAIARFTADGALDPTFGDAGVVLNPIDLGFATDVVVAGTTIWVTGGAGDQMALAAFDEDGQLAPIIGEGGVVYARPVDTGSFYAASLLLRPGGGFVLAGTGRNIDGGPLVAAVAALDVEGALDPRFGDGGIATYSFGDGTSDRFARMVRDAQGRLLLVGWSQDGVIEPLLARLTR